MDYSRAMKTCVWLLLMVFLLAPVSAAQEEAATTEKFLVKDYEVGEDGYWVEKPDGPGSFLAFSYVLLATGFVLGPIFKNARRTHLD